MARKRKWCEFEPMHFDLSAVLRCSPSTIFRNEREAEALLLKPAPSMEHQNLRVESAVPGYHATYLEHYQLEHQHSRRSDDEEQAVDNTSEGLSAPLLATSANRDDDTLPG